MHDFGRIVYLDFQKTGSSFVSQFLRAACLHPEIKLQKHVWIRQDYRPDAVYFTTIRQPLMLYSSLYRFGLEERGGVFKAIKSAGLISVYRSFESFVALLLDEENAEILHPHYTRKVASELGFLSFRHLLLSLQFPLEKVRAAVESNEPIAALMGQSIISHVLKNEYLNAELLRLSTEVLPEHFDLEKAREFLERAPRVNQSKLLPDVVQLQSKELSAAIEAKEALLLHYYHERAVTPRLVTPIQA